MSDEKQTNFFNHFMPAVHAFIDEYGNASLKTETPGTSHYFILAAVLVPEEKLAELRERVEKIRRRVFQTGEMKSSKLGADRSRWIRLLGELNAMPFSFYGLAVDKEQIGREGGLQYKRTFHKYLHGRVHDVLQRGHANLHVIADGHGGEVFMDSFAKYIEKNHRPNLFSRGTFGFVDSKEEVLVQLADIMAGLLARLYDPQKRFDRPEEIWECIRNRVLVVDEWPRVYKVQSADISFSNNSASDRRILQCSTILAEGFIDKNEAAPDEDMRVKIAVLKKLLIECKFGGASNWLSTDELLRNLRERGFPDKEKSWFRRSVIAPLRDSGMLIASSSMGYKLPSCRADLVAFVRHADSVCVPMIQRMNRACDMIKLATLNDVDVLAEDDFDQMRRLVAALV